MIEIQRPASGLVTALEPVDARLLAAPGSRTAAGSPTARPSTRTTACAVPPGASGVPLRRVWLTRGGGAGLLLRLRQRGPVAALPHRAHPADLPRRATGSTTRPSTSASPTRWSTRRSTEDPIVLVQDYHFALLPRMMRERLPRATIITFWHIPWPNPEAFGICPWREEMLDGMLGAAILGFHTQFHCNNFFDTVDRFLEARVDRETFAISLRRRHDRGAPLPDLDRVAAGRARRCSRRSPSARERVRERLGLPPAREARRRRRPARLHQGHPRALRARSSGCSSSSRAGSAVLLRPGRRRRRARRSTSTRTSTTRVRALAARINERFGRPGYQPIMLQDRAPRAGAGLRALPRRRPLLRQRACTTA